MSPSTIPSAPSNPVSALRPSIVRRIRERLIEIEQTHDVKVLLAVESGSRAWGFESPDSDYDCRFLYVHRSDWYFSVFEQRDVIETPIEDEGGSIFDVNGWDLRKALRLLAKSNPVLIEWLQSPIVYTALPSFPGEMLSLAKMFYKPTAAHYHYFHMARKNFREHLNHDRVKLKKYFYVIRPVLACLWIEQERGIPPMTLTELLDHVLPYGKVRDEIIALRERKMHEAEFSDGPPIPVLHDFLSAEVERLGRISVSGMNSTCMEPLDHSLRHWSLKAHS